MNKLFGFEIEKMKTWGQRAKGLMFRKKFNTALVFNMGFESRLNTSIHSCFVFFPFDALFLNVKKEIVDMKTVSPWQLFVAPKKPAQYIIEVPEGIIKKEKLKIGQKIQFK